MQPCFVVFDKSAKLEMGLLLTHAYMHQSSPQSQININGCNVNVHCRDFYPKSGLVFRK